MSQQVYYYASLLYKGPIQSIWPLLYLFVAVLLFSTPLFLMRVDEIKTISLSNDLIVSRKREKLLLCICVVYLIAALGTLWGIFPVISNIQNVFSVDVGMMNKSDLQHENYEILFSSKITTYMYNFWRSLNDIMTCLMFYFLSKKKNVLSFFLFLSCCILPILWGLSCANRQLSLCTVISCLIAFFVFRNALPKELRSRILKIAICLSIPFFVSFVLISVMRFGDRTDLLVYEMVRYFGESSLNFSSLLFENQVHNIWGAASFPQVLGISLDKMRSLIQYSAGVNGFFFYSFVGNFVIDFGKVLTMIAAMLVFFVSLSVRFFKVKYEKINLGAVILYHMWAVMCFQGIFFFTYALNKNALIMTFLFFCLLKCRLK